MNYTIIDISDCPLAPNMAAVLEGGCGMAQAVCFDIISDIKNWAAGAFGQDVDYFLDVDCKPFRFTLGWTERYSYSIDVGGVCRKMEPILASVHCR